MTILILGNDEHAQHIAEKTGAVMVNTRDFPHSIRLGFTEIGATCLKTADGETVVGGEIESVYWRSYDGVSPMIGQDGAMVVDDARGLFESFLTIPTRWVNGWDGWRLHQTKPRCLAMVEAFGIPVPKTLVTNDEDMAVKFVDRHRGQVIVKPVQGGWHTIKPEKTPVPWNGQPFTLQEFIPGTNIRVFLAGNRTVACEIKTGATDFRDDPAAKVTVHDLPAAIARRSRIIARQLSLTWTGIDYRLTPKGEYVFLEANPSPMFLEFERETGLPLTEMLVKLLTNKE